MIDKISNNHFIINFLSKDKTLEVDNLHILVNLVHNFIVYTSDYFGCVEYYEEVLDDFIPFSMKLGNNSTYKLINISYLSEQNIKKLHYDLDYLNDFTKKIMDIENKKFPWNLTNKKFLNGLIPKDAIENVFEDETKYICEFILKDNENFEYIENIVNEIKYEFGDNIIHFFSIDYCNHRFFYLKK